MLNGLDLFSRIGGMSIALKEWVRPVAYCEIDFYCQGVLLSRMANGELPKAPIWDDVRNLGYRTLCYAEIDIIYGGFPGQDISIAGTGKGVEGKRSGLFFEIIRLAKEIKPEFIFLENSKGILSNGGTEVIETLTSIGYRCRWITKSCKEVGSPQNRERWFCLAYANSTSNNGLPSRKTQEKPQSGICVKSKKWDKWPENESPLLGVDDVVPFRMDRARAMGNTVHIRQTREAFKELIGLA